MKAGRKRAVLIVACCLLACALLLWLSPGRTDEAVSESAVSESAASNSPDPALPALLELDAPVDSTSSDGYARALEASRQTIAAKDCKLHEVRASAAPKREWTVMLYMVGSNLESQHGAATDDIAEIEKATVDFENVNVVAYVGGAQRWNIDVPNNRNSVLDMSQDRDGWIVAQTDSSADMGAPETLASYVTWVQKNYPANHYALVFWDHGGGPLHGYGCDELNGGDALLLSEMREAMEATPFGGPGERLDLVGFDACLMGSAENALLWADYAQCMVASEEIEPGNGWDYSFLGKIGQTTNEHEFAEAAVGAFEAYYQEHVTPLSNPDATLAAYDLAKIGRVEEAVGNLAVAMRAEIGSGRYAELNRARASAKALGLAAAPTRGESYDLVDLSDLSQRLSDRMPDESQALSQALAEVMFASTSNVDGLGGMSIYFPGDNRELYQEVGSDLLGGAGAQYADFANEYARAWLAASDVDWRLGTPELSPDGTEFLLQLGSEQVANLSRAHFNVLFRSDEAYWCAAGNLPARIDDEGVLHVPAHPFVMVGRTGVSDAGESVYAYWPVSLVEENGAHERYVARSTKLSFFEDTFFREAYTEDLNISLQRNRGSDEVVIDSFVQVAGAGQLAGRSEVRTSLYRYITVDYGLGRFVTRGDDGRVLPFSQWERSGNGGSVAAELSSFRFEMKRLSDLKGADASLQLIASDVNALEHSAEIVEVPTEPSFHDVVKKTDAGELTFRVADDHAELSSYSGEDEKLTIPSEVDSVPVTAITGFKERGSNPSVDEVRLPQSVRTIGKRAFFQASSIERVVLPDGLKHIGDSAFQYCENLRSIDLPETIESIGLDAFSGTGVERLSIPSSLKEISEGAFAGMYKLREFSQTGANGVTLVRDGVLFSADGRRLLSFPAARTGSYEIPQGVQELGQYAFFGATVSSLSLGEGLKRIGCYSLALHTLPEDITLPDSIEIIESHAFGIGLNSENGGEYGEPAPGVLHIGKNATFIGKLAFDALNVGSIEVDDDNDSFADRGGLLTNKAGDTVLEAPGGIGSTVIVPEGVTTLPAYVFGVGAQAEFAREFHLPNSLCRISVDAFWHHYEDVAVSDGNSSVGDKVRVYDAVFHCGVGSAAETFALKHGIPCDYDVLDEMPHVEQVTIEPEDATFQVLVRGDSGTIVDCEFGANTEIDKLRIPAEAGGVPVTAIGFLSSAPNHAVVHTLTIPESIDSISTRLFAERLPVKRFEVDEGNEHFAEQAGVLFTADGKALVAYPSARDRVGAYVVPPGVEEVGDYAFVRANIRELKFSEDVRRIGKGACYGGAGHIESIELSEGLETIDDEAFYLSKATIAGLPATIERIGEHAFDGTNCTGEPELPRDLEYLGDYALGQMSGESLRIGSLLSHVGSHALANVSVSSFDVDDSNAVFESQGPLLIDKRTNSVFTCASAAVGEARIPDGCIGIEFGAFEHAVGVTDIFVPDSVEQIANPFGTGVSMARIHCNANSAMARFAAENDLQLVLEKGE